MLGHKIYSCNFIFILVILEILVLFTRMLDLLMFYFIYEVLTVKLQGWNDIFLWFNS